MPTVTSYADRLAIPFANEPLLRFDDAESAAMRQALARVSADLGREYPLIIGGSRVHTATRLSSVNPARPSQVVGVHAEADATTADRAVSAALDAFDTWRFAPVDERAGLLLRVAAEVRTRRLELSAWLAFEIGKNWREADAEVAEAIDFLEFYAREAIRLAESAPPIQFPGERGQLAYIPVGVCAVLPPWNFPFAILAGLTTAAIVCGNTAVVKPSPEAPTIAAIFMEILEHCGLPDGVVNLLQGGVDVGKALVEHPKTRVIAFTGSKAAGLDIHQRAAQRRPGQAGIKRTVLEMGGKDAIIVDREADLDEAVEGVVAAAFGFNGQKCSACSRVIVDEAVYDEFVAKLVPAGIALQHGDPTANAAVGPVINEAAYRRVLEYIETGAREGRILLGGRALTPAAEGYYIAPTIVADVENDARICQEEIFGPVLAVLRARNFEHAIDLANDTEYGLTGAVFSRNRSKLDRARERFHVGNLYLNRKCTGAMVGAHPFGGFNMSGTDSKAGGPDYLLLFTQAKTIAERVTTRD